MMEALVPDSVSVVQNVINATRNVESDFETGQEREIVVDSVDAEPKATKVEEGDEGLLAALKAEKEGLESTLDKEKIQTFKLKQELTDAETRNTDLYKVDVAELRQKLQTMDALRKEVEILQHRRAASEQAALDAKQRQSSGGVCGLLAGTPPSESGDA